jgi:hypothetical protein
MSPWERRLKDLGQLLTNCAATYFDPDLFRLNVNNFLQTSRTVTFVIQKNKAKIPNFDAWYTTNVTQAWAGDEVMKWAKDSRNVIEKEGDLELNSTLRVTLLFSYLEETDAVIQVDRADLLGARIGRLASLAKKSLPKHISDEAAIKVERRWITASLQRWELLHALSYVYTKIFSSCGQLAKHLGEKFEVSILEPGELDLMREEARGVRYLKLRTQNLHAIVGETVVIDPATFIPPDSVRTVFEKTLKPDDTPTDLRSTIEWLAEIARATFEHYGCHISMLFIFDEKWLPAKMMQTAFADRIDKYIFWRYVGDQIKRLRAQGLAWISESWVRQTSTSVMPESIPVDEIPIVGERLNVMGLDRDGNMNLIAWGINRVGDASPTLELVGDAEKELAEFTAYYLVPAMRSMGLPDSTWQRGSGVSGADMS